MAQAPPPAPTVTARPPPPSPPTHASLLLLTTAVCIMVRTVILHRESASLIHHQTQECIGVCIVFTTRRRQGCTRFQVVFGGCTTLHTNTHTYFDDGLFMASTQRNRLPTRSPLRALSKYNSFNANGRVSRLRRVHGCMWCQTEIRSNSRVITHSSGHEELVNTTQDQL